MPSVYGGGHHLVIMNQHSGVLKNKCEASAMCFVQTQNRVSHSSEFGNVGAL